MGSVELRAYAFDEVPTPSKPAHDALVEGYVDLGGASDPVNKQAWGSDASQATMYGGGVKYEYTSIPTLTKNDANAKRNR
jgi:hypothetical protein